MDVQPSFKVKKNSLNTFGAISILHENGNYYPALQFSNNPFSDNPTALVDASGRSIDDVWAVEVMECWNGGGRAMVYRNNPNSMAVVVFGKRKPGTVGKLSGARLFPSSRQRDGRRRGY